MNETRTRVRWTPRARRIGDAALMLGWGLFVTVAFLASCALLAVAR